MSTVGFFPFLIDTTAVKFSPKAFTHSFDYLDRQETKDDVDEYKVIINGGTITDKFAVSCLLHCFFLLHDYYYYYYCYYYQYYHYLAWCA